MNIHEFVLLRRSMEKVLAALIEIEVKMFLKRTGYPVVSIDVTLVIHRTVEKVVDIQVADVRCLVSLDEQEH